MITSFRVFRKPIQVTWINGRKRYIKLNEIPSDSINSNVIPIALWFGKNKPNMLSFFGPITNFLKRLSQNGIECELKESVLIVVLYTIAACVDVLARAPMQGFY